MFPVGLRSVVECWPWSANTPPKRRYPAMTANPRGVLHALRIGRSVSRGSLITRHGSQRVQPSSMCGLISTRTPRDNKRQPRSTTRPSTTRSGCGTALAIRSIGSDFARPMKPHKEAPAGSSGDAGASTALSARSIRRLIHKIVARLDDEDWCVRFADEKAAGDLPRRIAAMTGSVEDWQGGNSRPQRLGDLPSAHVSSEQNVHKNHVNLIVCR